MDADNYAWSCINLRLSALIGSSKQV